jgi:O-acetyl-ADP-ribose deacetylase (regulator of RNase III)
LEALPKVIFKTGDIVDEPSDGLVCSGNVQLNMSGGVNGELLVRGGLNMQRQLHDWLRQQGKRFVEPGFAMRIGPEPFTFKSIVYAVGIDCWYDSSVELVSETLRNAFELLQEDDCKTVAVPAIATGYGHLSKIDFGRALRKCIAEGPWAFEEVRVVLRSSDSLEKAELGFVAK